MKTLILNGCRENDDADNSITNQLTQAFQKNSDQVEFLTLRNLNIEYCRGDFLCWTKTPGICNRDDDGRMAAEKIIKSDVLVYLTPITFGGYSSALKRALDRVIPLISPFFMKINGEVHHKPRYGNYPNLIGIGLLNQKDEESERIFRQLVYRNSINFYSPFHDAMVFYRDDSPEKIQSGIDSLFSKMGASK